MNKTTKIVIWVIVLVLVVWGLSSVGKKAPVSTGSEPIKIGVILSLTGPIASSGEFAKNGVELAVKDLNKNSSAVEVLFEDNQYDAKVGLSAYNKLHTIDKVNAIIVFGTPPAMALTPIVNADKIPMLGLTASPPYSTFDDYTFRMMGTADSEAKFAVETLADKLGKKRLAILYLNNDYGRGALEALKRYVGDKAMIVAEESSTPGVFDYRAQLTKVKAAAPDAIFLATLYKEAGTILKQAREMGIGATFMCGQPCENPEIITTAGPAAEELIVVAPTDKETKNFGEVYEQAYGTKPSYLSLRIYDAMQLIASAASACKETKYSGECLKEKLDGFENFPGLSYPITFDDEGDINDQFGIKVIRNAEYVPYE